ncbi:SRPBCC family protein [Streptosporangium sp. NPDC000396]|uniref:SRPBCC family protein n=1 Tax=Streptosporangium sp. NPDC000396 TaxID=3366185 RepID=UPI0036A232F0
MEAAAAGGDALTLCSSFTLVLQQNATAHGQATVLIGCTGGQVLDFVMDPRAYATIDGKIGAIRWVRRAGDTVVFRFRARLLGVPGPLVTHRMIRTGHERVDIAPVPGPHDRLARFRASFTCAPHPRGTVVTRRLQFDLARPLAWLAPMLSCWLSREVPAELKAAKARLEQTG